MLGKTSRIGAGWTESSHTEFHDDVADRNSTIGAKRSTFKQIHAPIYFEDTGNTQNITEATRRPATSMLPSTSNPNPTVAGANRQPAHKARLRSAQGVQKRHLSIRQQGVMESDADPLTSCSMSPRHAATAGGSRLNGRETEGPGAAGRTQATCAIPLVPRPTSPRMHSESHPWCVFSCEVHLHRTADQRTRLGFTKQMYI